MISPYPRLFSELDIGPFALRNRIISTGHNPQFQGDDGLLGDEEIAFHVRKAEGGIALSATGGSSVHPSGGTQGGLLCFDDAVLPGYVKLAQGMHANGARMLVQLGHGASAARRDHDHHDDHDHHGDAAHSRAIDPVCGDECRPGYRHGQGPAPGLKRVDYFFCGKGCKLEFGDDPERFLEPTYVPSM